MLKHHLVMLANQLIVYIFHIPISPQVTDLHTEEIADLMSKANRQGNISSIGKDRTRESWVTNQMFSILSLSA